jgi:hypothetical protein
MLKVTLVSAVVYLNILLFNECGGHREARHDSDGEANSEEIRYENRLDTLYERKIDSAYSKMGGVCDSTLEARWRALSDSILHSALDSAGSRHGAHPVGGL